MSPSLSNVKSHSAAKKLVSWGGVLIPSCLEFEVCTPTARIGQPSDQAPHTGWFDKVFEVYLEPPLNFNPRQYGPYDTGLRGADCPEVVAAVGDIYIELYRRRCMHDPLYTVKADSWGH